MTTLITGGTGFLGSSLAHILVDHGETPVLFDPSPPCGALASLGEQCQYVRGTVSNLSSVLDAVKRCSAKRIFHLGGMLSVPSENDPSGAFDSNVVGTHNVLEAARLEGVAQVVYSSTIAVYSKDLPSYTIDDCTLQRPTSMYGTTKVFGELLGLFYARKYGLDFRGVRLPSVVGPGAKTAHMSIYNAWAIEEPLKGNPYELRVAPDTKCPAIYFKDAARSLWMLSQAQASRIETRVYNIAGIRPAYSAQELADRVRNRVPGARLTFNPDPATMELLKEIGKLEIDDSRAQSEWDWQIAYSLPEMIEDFIEEFNRNRSCWV
ncbi:MAG: NAD-dependent epimerase/dehydratase family protein [Syntrophobacteraceae bacterium]